MTKIGEPGLGKILYKDNNLGLEELKGLVTDSVEYWIVPKKWLPTKLQKMYWDYKSKKYDFSYKFWSGIIRRGNFSTISKDFQDFTRTKND